MIFIGLQNAEKKYEKTRHNVGAILLSQFPKSEDYKIFSNDTFMNLSGGFVKKVLKKENISTKDDLREKVFVFFDDVTMPVGKYKISVGEGASSHNGIKSIIENLGGNNTFTRVRIGVGNEHTPSGEELSDFVLSNLNNLEIVQIKSMAKEILDKLTCL